MITHDPRVCPQPSSCIYLFSAFYDQTATPRALVNFLVTASLAQQDSISIDQTYRDTLFKGTYHYYQLLPGNSDAFGFIDQLTIKVQNLLGDADLVASVSTSTPRIDQDQFESRESDLFDSIVLSRTPNFTLNQPIYIGVYASSYAVYYLSFEVKYAINYNIKTERATPLVDSQANYVQMTDETQEVFFSFMPWWAGFENRTMVLFGEIIFNKIFFYMKFNDFPQFYTTDW